MLIDITLQEAFEIKAAAARRKAFRGLAERIREAQDAAKKEMGMPNADAGGLLPCPFCGGKAHIVRFGDRKQSTQYACEECGCSLETGEEWDHGRRWNQRS